MLKAQEKQVGPRGNVMTSLHWLTVAACSAGVLIIFALASMYEEQMYLTKHGENYQCTDAALEEADGTNRLANLKGMDEDTYESQELNKDQLAEQDQYLYNPKHCIPFYQKPDEPYWYGRVENLHEWNQNLYVYGYLNIDVEMNQLVGTFVTDEIDVEFHSAVRGKNMDDQEWTLIQDIEDIEIDIRCNMRREACEIFQVAYIPILHYEMYDVMIEVKRAENHELTYLARQMHFEMAYINPEYTRTQLVLRVVCCLISFLALMLYSCKLCKTNKRFRGSVSCEMYSINALLFGLFAFNDPFYIVHVNNPSFFTYSIAELQNAAFFSGLLMFWIKDLGLQKTRITDAQGRPVEDKPEAKAQETKEERRKRVNKNSCVTIAISAYFFILTISLIVLYSLYYQHIQYQPSFNVRRRSDRSQDIRAALGIVLFLLALYYICYIIAFVRNCQFCRQTDKTTKVVFATSQIVHFLVFLSFIMGVYSRHYANGGVQIFLIGMCNWYIILLMYLNWPVQMLSQEFDVDQNVEMHGRPSQLKQADSFKNPRHVEIDKNQADPQQVEIDIQQDF